jgi:hypothetical protein
VKTTTDLITAPISLVVNRDDNGQASGSLLLDQGISRAEIASSNYEYLKFSYASNSLNKLFTSG